MTSPQSSFSSSFGSPFPSSSTSDLSFDLLGSPPLLSPQHIDFHDNLEVMIFSDDLDFYVDAFDLLPQQLTPAMMSRVSLHPLSLADSLASTLSSPHSDIFTIAIFSMTQFAVVDRSLFELLRDTPVVSTLKHIALHEYCGEIPPNTSIPLQLDQLCPGHSLPWAVLLFTVLSDGGYSALWSALCQARALSFRSPQPVRRVVLQPFLQLLEPSKQRAWTFSSALRNFFSPPPRLDSHFSLLRRHQQHPPPEKRPLELFLDHLASGQLLSRRCLSLGEVTLLFDILSHGAPFSSFDADTIERIARVVHMALIPAVPLARNLAATFRRKLDENSLAFQRVLDLCSKFQLAVFSPVSTELLTYLPDCTAEPLGFGTSSQVSRALYNGNPVAVKTVHVTDAALLRNELTMLTLLDHPYLIQPVGGSIVDRIIVLPLSQGSLYELVSSRHEPISIHLSIPLLLHIAEALVYIHRLGIMHRDLKSPNILIDGPELSPLLIDFGVARLIDLDHKMTRAVGSFAWMAPEMLSGSQRYDFSCDIYSFGIVMFEVLAAPRRPYAEDASPFHLYDQIRGGLRPVIPKSVPKQLAALMKMCWQASPHKRPQALEIVSQITSIHTKLLTGSRTRRRSKSIDIEISRPVEPATHLGYVRIDPATGSYQVQLPPELHDNVVSSLTSPPHPPTSPAHALASSSHH